MQDFGFIVVALAIVGFALVSGRAQRSIVTPPMVFVLFGLLVGPRFLGLVELSIETPWIHTLAELTLILVLFTDASRIEIGVLRRDHDLPVRMLALGLPLTIVFGLFAAVAIFPGLSLWEAAVLAAILAPTDAALGQAVVSSPRVPPRIRQALNVESGLNDGVMLPVLLILISCGSMGEPGRTAGYWFQFTAKQVVLGPIVGIAVGYLGGRLVERGSRSGWISHAFQQLSALGLALMAFALAELAGGNGYISAFCAGLMLGNSARALCSCLHEFAEAEGQLLTLLIFMVFGVAMVPIALDHLSRAAVLYAAISLTVVRMIPVALSLLGARLRFDTQLFLGWFGPRGIASILFALLVLERSLLPAREEILSIVIAVVLFSVFAHGITAHPAAAWYGARIGGPKPDMEEHAAVAEMPLRLRS